MSYLKNLKDKLKKKIAGNDSNTLNTGKIVCPSCGTCCEVDVSSQDEDGNWLGCIAPTGFEWSLPSGRIVPAIGDVIYVDALGNHLTRGAYMEKYSIDPEIAYNKMRDKKRGNLTVT